MGFLNGLGGLPPEALIGGGMQLMGSAGMPNQQQGFANAGNAIMSALQQRRAEERRAQELEARDPLRFLMTRQEMERGQAVQDEAEEMRRRSEALSSVDPLVQRRLAPLLKSPDFWKRMSSEIYDEDQTKYINSPGGVLRIDESGESIIEGTQPSRPPVDPYRVGGGGVYNRFTGEFRPIEGGEGSPSTTEARLRLGGLLKRARDIEDSIYNDGEVDRAKARSIARRDYADLYDEIDAIDLRLRSQHLGGRPSDKDLTRGNRRVGVPDIIYAYIPKEVRDSLTEEDKSELASMVAKFGVEGTVEKLREFYGQIR